MYSFYLVCFLIGGSLLACQVLLSLLGLSHVLDFGGHDVHDLGHAGHGHTGDHDHEASWFAELFTFRTLTAAATFFGLGGLTGYARFGPDAWWLTLAVAFAAGTGALLLVAFLMRSMGKLRADGTAHIERAVGESGTVYLTIPAARAGVGKVTVPVQNRTMEYKAVTPDAELPTGAQVVVVGIVDSETVEVVPLSPSGA
ncbi:MAG TPA: hypothetical protein VJ739_15080 [Gemmataceae bacterium]|nr:hypothetical protein [Gemmataceae bacterium]